MDAPKKPTVPAGGAKGHFFAGFLAVWRGVLCERSLKIWGGRGVCVAAGALGGVVLVLSGSGVVVASW